MEVSRYAQIVGRKEKGNKIALYVVTGNDEQYLFSQNYSDKLYAVIKRGLSVTDALSLHKYGSRKDPSFGKIADKLSKHIKYIEKTYDLHILRTSFIKTANKVHLEQYRGDRYEVEL